MLPVCAAVLLQGRSIATILSLGAAPAPMVAITAVAGLYYLDIRHGITWQPRFVLSQKRSAWPSNPPRPGPRT